MGPSTTRAKVVAPSANNGLNDLSQESHLKQILNQIITKNTSKKTHQIIFQLIAMRVCFADNFLSPIFYSKVWSMLYYGSVGRVQSKECYFLFKYSFLAFVLVVIVFHQKIGFLSFSFLFLMKYEISTTEYLLTNQKLELLIRNCQWNCLIIIVWFTNEQQPVINFFTKLFLSISYIFGMFTFSLKFKKQKNIT